MPSLELNVMSAGPVTTFARYTRDQAFGVVAIRARVFGEGAYVCCMAFQTCRVDGAREVGCPIDITGAVDPTMSIAPVAHRQLEEPISLPVQIRLSSHS